MHIHAGAKHAFFNDSRARGVLAELTPPRRGIARWPSSASKLCSPRVCSRRGGIEVYLPAGGDETLGWEQTLD